MKIIYLALFGAIGVLLRYALQLFTVPSELPLATFGINVVGSFFIGVVYSAATIKGWIGPELRSILSTGLLGGFTTFSAFSLETLLLLQSSEWLWALAYAFGSLILGVAACALGMITVKAF